MPMYCITFGQSHAHSINGQTLDKDCWAEVYTCDIDQARAIADSTFKQKYCMIHEKECFLKRGSDKYYPRGGIRIG